MIRRAVLGVTLLVFTGQLFAQQNTGAIIAGQDTSRRVIVTAVPFVGITPDARLGGMGDAGSSVSADANATYWNIAKLAFAKGKFGASISYTPWLSKIVDDMFIGYLTGYGKIGRNQAVAFSLTYFDLGDIDLADDFGGSLGTVSPREFAVSASYSRKLSEMWGIGATGRFIVSNINQAVSNPDAQSGKSFAVDLAGYFNKDILIGRKNANIAASLVFQNIGSKITYNSSENQNFIPINLRLGTALNIEANPYNTFTFAFDITKLMVPTPPVYEFDENGTIVTDPDTGEPVIARGKDPNRSVLSGMFGSFADAPDGFSEEMQEIQFAVGFEYWYRSVVAGRMGYFHENVNKGNRRYLTFGLGFRVWQEQLGIDLAYLVPIVQNHPLAETLRLTILWELDPRGDN